MRPVSRLSEVEANIRLLASYVAEGSGIDAEFAKGLIERGICFVVVRRGGTHFSAPSRFVGYVGNSRRTHAQTQEKDGRETNRALIELTGSRPRPSQRLEREYRAFCARLGISPRAAGSFGVIRKFWDLR